MESRKTQWWHERPAKTRGREPHPKKRRNKKPQEDPHKSTRNAKWRKGEKERRRGTRRDEPATRKRRKRPKAETSNTVRTHKGEEEEHNGKDRN